MTGATSEAVLFSGLMAWSPEQLRRHCRVLVAHARQVRAAAEAARLRSVALKIKAATAHASANARQATADAATDRNHNRKQGTGG